MKEREALHEKLVSARVVEERANTIVDANVQRAEGLARELEGERRRRADEVRRLTQEVQQAKEEHRVEVMAYRRALSTEEAKVVVLQKELKEARDRVMDMAAGGAAKAGGAKEGHHAGMISMVGDGSHMGASQTGGKMSTGALSLTGGNTTVVGGLNAGNVFGRRKKRRIKLKAMEDIYSPLASTVPAGKVGGIGGGHNSSLQRLTH